jgi:hypothetical protein
MEGGEVSQQPPLAASLPEYVKAATRDKLPEKFGLPTFVFLEQNHKS